MTAYEPRPIRFLELWQPSDWRLKLYGIAYRKERPNAKLIAAAKRVFEPLLATAAAPNYRVGFVGVHEGKTADFIFLDFWADENELHHHVFVSPVGKPDALRCATSTGLSACVWDLRLQSFERDAWVAHVLRRATQPDFEGYLAKRLNEQACSRHDPPICAHHRTFNTMDITKLPFNESIGLVRSSDEGCVFRLPADVRYTNHLGTIHASALMAVAEATSGELLLRALGDTGTDVIPVVRRFESKFRKAATGSIRSKGTISADGIAIFISTLRSKGRATIDIAVEIYDESAACVLSAKVEWFVATRSA